MFRLISCLLILASVAPAAERTAEEVEVTTVRFSNQRSPAGTAMANGNWYEAEVTLSVRPPPGTRGQMVSRVRVSLLLGFELPALSNYEPGRQGNPEPVARRLEHYRAEAECVALEAGRTDVRFYLPPELVKRDQLHGDPKYWGVELTVGGKPLPAARGAYSTSLAGAEQRKNFQTKGGQAAAANDGILLPQYLTPFENQYPRATPSFVRKETR